jgi:hydrogenase 3 maturation protease
MITHHKLGIIRSKRREWRVRLDREILTAKRISILGTGNGLREDDRIGLVVTDRLSLLLSGTELPNRLVQIIKGYEVPENYTGEIRRFKPDLVLIIDAAIEKFRPGEIFFVDPSSIVSEDISTHRIPLSALVKYLEAELSCRVSILGIQPTSMDLGERLSTPVYRAGKRLSRVLFRSLKLGPPPP